VALSRDPQRRSEAGFTYIAVLIALAIIALTAIGGAQVGAVMQRRAAEQSLLDVGHEFRAALNSYAMATPAGLPTAPKSLQDLVRDPRYPKPKRHLRKVYFDPMTGSQTWGLLKTPDGTGIIGIFSLSTGHPIKVGNFLPADQLFQNKKSYSEWVFMPGPTARAAPAPVPTPAPPK
jgi:type II secretory pathway pseudopilin PulG